MRSGAVKAGAEARRLGRVRRAEAEVEVAKVARGVVVVVVRGLEARGVADRMGSKLRPRRRKARAEKSSEKNSAGPILAWQ